MSLGAEAAGFEFASETAEGDTVIIGSRIEFGLLTGREFANKMNSKRISSFCTVYLNCAHFMLRFGAVFQTLGYVTYGDRIAFAT